jgi:hypothetical protein
MTQPRPSYPPVILHTDQQDAPLPVGQANDCLHKILVRQRPVLFSLEFNGEVLTTSDNFSYSVRLNHGPPPENMGQRLNIASGRRRCMMTMSATVMRVPAIGPRVDSKLGRRLIPLIVAQNLAVCGAHGPHVNAVLFVVGDEPLLFPEIIQRFARGSGLG